LEPGSGWGLKEYRTFPRKALGKRKRRVGFISAKGGGKDLGPRVKTFGQDYFGLRIWGRKARI